MAEIITTERYTNAMIDAKDKTITEYHDDAVKVYSLMDLINRWDGISGISLIVQLVMPALPESEGDG